MEKAGATFLLKIYVRVHLLLSQKSDEGRIFGTNTGAMCNWSTQCKIILTQNPQNIQLKIFHHGIARHCSATREPAQVARPGAC